MGDSELRGLLEKVQLGLPGSSSWAELRVAVLAGIAVSAAGAADTPCGLVDLGGGTEL